MTIKVHANGEPAQMPPIFEMETITYQGKVVFEKVVMSSRFKRFPKFFQENEACFLFLTKGAFQFRTPTNLLSFREGDAMLSRCGNYFFEEVTTNPLVSEDIIIAVGGYFHPEIVKEFFNTDLSIRTFQRPVDTTKLDVEPLMRSFVDSIDHLLEHPALADPALVANKMKELLLLLSKTEQAASIHDFVASLFVPFEYDFKAIIQQNLFANLSLDEFARLCHCSVATFKRKFAGHYQESPARYFLKKRLEKGAHMLRIDSLPIGEIAEECGFDHVANFNKAFKKHFQQTPSAYRLS